MSSTTLVTKLRQPLGEHRSRATTHVHIRSSERAAAARGGASPVDAHAPDTHAISSMLTARGDRHRFTHALSTRPAAAHERASTRDACSMQRKRPQHARRHRTTDFHGSHTTLSGGIALPRTSPLRPTGPHGLSPPDSVQPSTVDGQAWHAVGHRTCPHMAHTLPQPGYRLSLSRHLSVLRRPAARTAGFLEVDAPVGPCFNTSGW